MNKKSSTKLQKTFKRQMKKQPKTENKIGIVNRIEIQNGFKIRSKIQIEVKTFIKQQIFTK